MLHIRTYSTAINVLHLVLEGALDNDHVVAMQEVVADARRHGFYHWVLHCEALHAIDDECLKQLLQMKRNGALLEGLPMLLTWKLHHLEQQPESAL